MERFAGPMRWLEFEFCKGLGRLNELRLLPPQAQGPWAGRPYLTWDFPDHEKWTSFYRTAAGFLIRFDELADFEVSADGLRVTCAPTPMASNATIEHLYFNQVLPLALGRQGKLVFHASSVEITGGAIAFPAPSGRGKSSLAAAFAVDGSPFLTDDGLLVAPVEGGYEVQPSHASLRLWSDSRERLLGAGAKVAPAVDYTPKTRLLAGEALPHCDAPRRLIGAFFLGDGSERGVVIRPLSAAEALIEWAKHSFLLDVEDRDLIAAHFDRVATLANRVPCFALDYPRRYDVLPHVLDTIRDHVRNMCPSP
jgi:hypothetical protein